MKMAPMPAAVLAVLVVNGFLASGQPLTVLHNFDSSSSAPIPMGRPLLAGGTVYGVSGHGGSNDAGIVYSVNTDGTGFAVLHDFSSDTNGGSPEGGLLLIGDALYGTTALGGTNGPFGTVFSISTNGSAFNVLHHFNSDPTIGQHPHPHLTMAEGTMYGVASGQASPGWGSLFSIQTDGSTFNSFYAFTTPQSSSAVLTNSDGEQPQGALIPSGGMFYGTAYGGGTGGYGTVYSISPDGNNFSVLHAFTNNPDGAWLRAGLILADGVLYGTTSLGGSSGQGTVFSVNTDGTGYQVLHSFQTNGVDGINPWTSVVLWRHTLYGTTQRGGGTNAHGILFSINTNGSAYTVVHTFILPSGIFTNYDGTEPMGDMMVSGNTIYGTTQRGGALGGGALFSLALPRPGISGFHVAGTSVQLSATKGVPGETYTLVASSDANALAAQWSALATNTADASGNLTFTATDPGAQTAGRRFYMLQMR
jgi:uncharacterized repeat protein (TIGR03803 family)